MLNYNKMKNFSSLFLIILCSFIYSKEAILTEKQETQNSGDSDSSFTSAYDRLKNAEITPEAGPVVSNGADVYIMADYIYWYASEQGLSYVGSNFYYNQTEYFQQAAPKSNQQFRNGRVYTPGNKASSGFKVGMGLDFDYDGWDLGVYYTWYRNHASDSVSAPLNSDSSISNNLTPIIYQEYATASHVVFASSQFKLALNIIDFELGREFFVSPKLVVRPYLGMKSTWGHQYFVINETVVGELRHLYPFYQSASTDQAESLYTTTNTQGNWGFGVKCGLDSSWMFSKRFSLYGECAITTLWQYLRATRLDLYNNIVSLATNEELLANYLDVNYHQRIHMVNPVLETQIGLRYDYLFSEDHYRFRAQLGWESQVWFNQNVFLTQYGDGQNYYNLGLQGLTAHFRLDF